MTPTAPLGDSIGCMIHFGLDVCPPPTAKARKNLVYERKNGGPTPSVCKSNAATRIGPPRSAMKCECLPLSLCANYQFDRLLDAATDSTPQS